MKGHCTKVFVVHLRPYIPILRYWPEVTCIYEIVIAFIGYSPEIPPHLPLLLSFHVTTLFLHVHTVYIHPPVSTINSMDGVLCRVIVSERLKMRKSPAINYWQDAISGVEFKSNDRNVKILWGVSNSFEFCASFHFNTFFFNSWKIQVSKNLEVGGTVAHPPPSPTDFGFYGPAYISLKIPESFIGIISADSSQ